MIYFNAIMNLICLLFLLGLVTDWVAAKLGFRFRTVGRLDLQMYEHREKELRLIVTRLQARAKHDVEIAGHFIHVVDDLIRIEPERAETLEIVRLELTKWREELTDWDELIATFDAPLTQQLRTIRRLDKKLRRRKSR